MQTRTSSPRRGALGSLLAFALSTAIFLPSPLSAQWSRTGFDGDAVVGLVRSEANGYLYAGTEQGVHRSSDDGRTWVTKAFPRCFSMAASAFASSLARSSGFAEKATLPLDSSVLTSRNPTASKQRLSSGILQFMGLTPRRKATYRSTDVTMRYESRSLGRG